MNRETPVTRNPQGQQLAMFNLPHPEAGGRSGRPAQAPQTIARYRVALVHEEDTPYGDVACSDPEAAAKFLEDLLRDRTQEHMVALYLDTRNRVIGWTVAHVGTLSRAACEPRTILQVALALNAAGFIVAHNHPSGDPSPSAEDVSFTCRMRDAGEAVGPRLVDHLIIGRDGRWVSLRQRGAF